MADRQLINYIQEEYVWVAHIKKISELKVSDNVIFFMQQSLKDLNPEITDVLKIIGVLGHNAEYEILEIVLDKKEGEIKRILSRPFEDGLLIEQRSKIRFAHDKVQQACYMLNREEELPEVHFHIASILINHDLYHNIDDLFSVVSHLNKAFLYVEKQPARFFHIYLMAALKSKEISAYREFMEYIEKSLKLINPETEEKSRYKCYSEYHVALHLNGKYEEADRFFEEKLLGYHDMFALKDNYVTKVSQDSMLGKYEGATRFGLSILEKLGIYINMAPHIPELTEILSELRDEFKQHGIVNVQDLAKIPKVNPEETQFTCELISAIVPGSFFFTPLVSSLLIFETIRLALKNGVYSSMAYPFSVATAPFMLVENNFRRGYEYAEFAMQISGNDKRSLGNSKHLFILFCWHWLKPLKDDKSLEIAREAFHLLLKGGDIQMSGFIFFNTIPYLFERGEALDEVLAETQKGLDYAKKTANFHALGPYSVWEQFMLSMMDENASTTDFTINGFDEEKYLKDNENNTMGRCFLYIYKTQYLYIHKHYELAYKYALKSKEVIASIAGFIPMSNHYFYGGLSYCRKYRDNPKLAEELDVYIDQLKMWSDQMPDNWLQKYYLVMAEKLRFSENRYEAINYYEKAIKAARKNDFTQDIALARELFADFWYEQDNHELGNAMLEKAHQIYRKWGALLKLKTIESNNPELANKVNAENIDLLNIIKSQNLLARETRIDILLKKMLQVLINTTGAEKCYLILKEKDWQIEAYMDIEGRESILEGIKLSPEMLSVDIVNYAIRTKQSILSQDLKTQIKDKYYIENKPKSTFVLPVINQSELVAVIYLEHTKIENMFTGEKQETIRLLSSQMAISLVNARLYQKLEDKVNLRTEELETANKELISANEEFFNINEQLDNTLKNLKRSEAELRESNKTKDKFFSIIAHDLKGSVGSVANMLEATETGEIELEDEVVSELSSAMKNTYNLLEDLLLWARSQQKTLIPSPKVLDVSDLIHSAISVHQLQAEKKKIKLQASNIAKNLLVFADWQMTYTILRNLVSNAIKFTPVSGSVILSASKFNGMVQLDVVDTGIGMSEETLNSLFKVEGKVISKKGTNNEGGTGLGLIVCKELIELNKGKIGVKSSINEGSTFWIKIPAGEDIMEKQSNKPEFLLKQKTLYIEDNPVHIENSNVILNKLGLSWDISTTGREGMKKALSEDYTLLFLDIQLPDISGIEIARIIRKEKGKRVTIIALSSYNEYEIKKMAEEELFDGYMQKPLDWKELENIFID